MKLPSDNRRRLRCLALLLTATYLPTLVALGVVVMVNLRTQIRISEFTRDPIQVLGGPIYTGVLSNVGILLWCATAAIMLFSWQVVRNSRLRHRASFFLAGGLLTALLLLDDFFLFHEVLFPNYLHFPENTLPAIYFAMVAAFLIAFRRELWRLEGVILTLALCFFAASVSIDIIDVSFHGMHLFEDGFKLLGIVSWSTFFTFISVLVVRELTQPVPAAGREF